MTFVGFDLHKRHITACALDGSGAIIAEIRQLATTIESVLDWLSALPAPVTVAMEATLYWEWLVARLQQQGHAAHVAHAYQVKSSGRRDQRPIRSTPGHLTGVGEFALMRLGQAPQVPAIDENVNEVWIHADLCCRPTR